MKRHIYRALRKARVPELTINASPRRLTIVMYHGFTADPNHRGLLNTDGLHANLPDFRRQLGFLRDNYTVISLAEALDAFDRGGPLPRNPAVITIDDGYASNYHLAFPVLRELSLPATIFLATNFVDRGEYLWTDRVEYAIGTARDANLEHWAQAQFGRELPDSGRAALFRRTKALIKGVRQEERRRLIEDLEARLGTSLGAATQVPSEYEPLNWNQVHEMLASGLISIGSHSASHYILARCTPEEIAREVHSARDVIEDRTGTPCPLFCYPNGQPGDFDDQTRKAVIDAGHRCALTTVPGFNSPRDDRYTLRRVGVMNGASLDEFSMAVSGIAWLAQGARRALGVGKTTP